MESAVSSLASRDRPIFWAHRGAAAEMPENTLPAFVRALELGAHAIETDAHLTADGHVVLSHDPDGARMTGMPCAYKRTRLVDIQSLDAGWGFIAPDGSRPHAGRGIRVPTLEEVLIELPEVPINIDLKQRAPSMVAHVLRVIRRARAEHRVVIASFELRTLLAVRAAGYAGMTGLSRPEFAASLVLPRPLFRALPLVGNAAQIPYRFGPVDLGTPRVIERCHALGMRVDFWTVNEPALARRLLEAGADGIMTDDPRALAPVFAAMQQTGRQSTTPRSS